MNRLLTFFSFFLFINMLFGQVYIIPKSTNTDTNSCNNEVVIEAYNIPLKGMMFLFYQGQPINLYVQNGDTVQNMCYFQENYLSSSSNTIDFLSSNGYISNYQGGSTLVPQHLDYTVMSYGAPTNNQNNDGFIVFQFDSLDVLNNYDLSISQPGTNVDTAHLDSRTMRLDSIMTGYLDVGVINPLDSSDYIQFRFIFGDFDTLYPNTGLDVNFAFQHAGTGCDGWILLQPVNATGSYQNVWDDQTYDINFKDNLCPGVYSVYSYDNIAATQVGSVDTIVLVNGNNVFVDSSIYVLPPQDTTYFFSSNCSFDYNAPIDSVQYFEDTIYNSGGVVIVNFDMIMYQDSNMVTVSDSMVLLNDSLIMLDVVIYCESFLKVGFQGKRILFLRGANEHTIIYLDNKPNILPIEFQMYPVPTGNELNFKMAIINNYSVQIFDANGKSVTNKYSFVGEFYSLPVSQIPAGIYFVKIESDTGFEMKKFIKE